MLGQNSTALSFKAPIKKFVQRVQEVCSGGAPAAASIVRYNQRVISVLSYVAQFVEPPKELGLAALAHPSVHSILRVPPNCMSRKLTNSIVFVPWLILSLLFRIVLPFIFALPLLRPSIFWICEGTSLIC